MKKRIILKELSILIFTSIITISTITVSSNSNELSEKNEKHCLIINSFSDADIVWDNNMNYTDTWYAIWDEVNNFDMTIADDFLFIEDTVLNKMKWIGGYSDLHYPQGNFDWSIVFYDDDGSENAAGIIKTVSVYNPNQYDKFLLEDSGYHILYEYSINLTEPIYFEGNTKYWVAMFGMSTSPPTSILGLHGSQLLHSSIIGSTAMGIPYWSNFDYDTCYQLIEAKADLKCEGNLSWMEIEPGSVVKGNFLLENIGEKGSLLDWEIQETPEWGTWIFYPDDGEDLTPEDGTIKVNVTVIAPEKKKKDFNGHISIINTKDNSDFELIEVSLSTPFIKQKNNNLFYNRILNLFPNVFPILKYILTQ